MKFSQRKRTIDTLWIDETQINGCSLNAISQIKCTEIKHQRNFLWNDLKIIFEKDINVFFFFSFKKNPYHSNLRKNRIHLWKNESKFENVNFKLRLLIQNYQIFSKSISNGVRLFDIFESMNISVDSNCCSNSTTIQKLTFGALKKIGDKNVIFYILKIHTQIKITHFIIRICSGSEIIHWQRISFQCASIMKQIITNCFVLLCCKKKTYLKNTIKVKNISSNINLLLVSNKLFEVFAKLQRNEFQEEQHQSYILI